MSACSKRSSASTPPASTGSLRKSSGRCGCCGIRSSPYSVWRSNRIRMTFAGRPASGSSPGRPAPGPSCPSRTRPPPGSSKRCIRPVTASPTWNRPLRQSGTPTRWSSSPTGRSSGLWTSAGSVRSCEPRSSLTGEISSSRPRCRRPVSSTTASAAGRRPSARSRNGRAYEPARPIFRERDARAKLPGRGVGGIVAIAPPASLPATDAPIARAITPDIFRASTSTCVPALVRPHVRGKFLFAGDEKFYVRGVTYGAFQPDASGHEYHDPRVIERDFAQMAANGINTVRIPHTMPPRSLLGAARRHGLRVMVGLSAEQYLGFLIDRKKSAADIEALVRAKVRECAGHPALLCYALGNEIPSTMARWLGRRKIERYLKRLCRVIKEEDPDGLVTYVNYPTTEYLQLPFLDLVCFNVYLESQERFEAYLARLQNIAGDRPLIMSELGLDGLRNGEGAQARSLDWQVRTAFAAGCAGVFVFSWTDEWYRHGHDVEDWAFGLTRADRSPKPALAAVREALAEVPFPANLPWPRISVVVCSYNGARTIRDCLDGLEQLAYPDYEVIVVDDG